MKLQDKICLVVGASSGMGRKTAIEAGKQGAHVILAARRVDDCEAAAQIIRDASGSAEGLFMDGTDRASVEQAFKVIDEKYGRLDCAFNNLGNALGDSPVHETPVERWNDTLAINLTSVFNLIQFEIPLMKKAGGGSIVNNSSTGGIRGVRNMADYAAAKWGLVGLTKSSALDYGDDNIRVNVIAPGIITTEKAEKIQANMPELFDQLRNQIPGKRFGEMQDIAHVVTWLLSDEARYISGATIPVDAGKTAG